VETDKDFHTTTEQNLVFVSCSKNQHQLSPFFDVINWARGSGRINYVAVRVSVG